MGKKTKLAATALILFASKASAQAHKSFDFCEVDANRGIACIKDSLRKEDERRRKISTSMCRDRSVLNHPEVVQIRSERKKGFKQYVNPTTYKIN